MVLRFLAGAAVAALLLACLGPTPALAGKHKGWHVQTSSSCCKSKKAKQKKIMAACSKYCAIVTALSAKNVSHSRNHKSGKWHGWVASRSGFAFYLDGARYKGGVPCGPPMAYNNWEGGFNSRAFWTLTDRDRY